MTRYASHVLLGVVALLVALGIIMLVSIGMWSGESQVDAYFNLKRQFAWLGLAVVLCVVASRVPFTYWQRFAPWIYGIACVMLALCFVPHVGVNINGSSRWINLRAVGLGNAQIQPSEFAKLAVVMGLAAWYVHVGNRSRELIAGFVIPGLIVLLPLALVGAEVDLGAAALIGLSSFAIMFAAGSNMVALAASVLAGLAAIGGAIKLIPNRARRFTEFFDVLKNPLDHLQDTGMQQVRAMMAFDNGSMGGVGLGNGQQKIMGLPYAHTDFIFPMVGEELGMWATLGVVFCYALLLVFGMLIALHAPGRFGKLLGIGCVVLIALQATLNIAVTTVCLPNKGLPLPLVSYGGSNLLFCLLCVGVLLNLHRHAVYPEAKELGSIKKRRVTPRA